MVKKELVFISLITVIILTNLTSAAQIEMKQEFMPGETIFATIKGTIIEKITPSQVYFYRGHVQVPALFDIARINNEYKIYALLPIQENNFTLKIKNIWTREGNKIEKTNIEKNFTVRGNKTFSVFPGFIFTDKDFSLKIENFQEKDAEIKIKYENQSKNIILQGGETKKITIPFTANLSNIEISSNQLSYNIPVIITSIPEPTEKKEKIKRLGIQPKEIAATIKSGESWRFKFWVTNLGEEELSNISFKYDELKEKITIIPEKINYLHPLNSTQINLTINTDENIENKTITIFSENISTSLLLNLQVTENASEITYTSAVTEEKTCSELGGYVCGIEEVCSSGETVFTEEGNCCIGLCEEKPKKSYWWVGVLIIAIVLIIIIVIYLKSKKYKPKDILAQREKKYEEKIHPTSSPIKGKLTKF